MPFEIAPNSELLGVHIPFIAERSSIQSTQHTANADAVVDECLTDTTLPRTPMAKINSGLEDSFTTSIGETKEHGVMGDKFSGSSEISPELPEACRIAKLERLNQLLSEAAKLQLEVFG